MALQAGLTAPQNVNASTNGLHLVRNATALQFRGETGNVTADDADDDANVKYALLIFYAVLVSPTALPPSSDVGLHEPTGASPPATRCDPDECARCTHGNHYSTSCSGL